MKLRFDWAIADMTNGRNGCGGAAAALNVDVITADGSSNNAIDCNILPSQAADLLNVVVERRLEFLRNGDLGRVTVRDIPTDPNGPESDQSEGEGEEENASDGVILNLPQRESN